MKQPENNPALSNKILKERLATFATKTAKDETPAAFRLNGGNPIALGFNVHLNIGKFNKENLNAVFKNPDPRLFPFGTGNMKIDELASFIEQVEGPLMKWLSNKANLVLFTTNPVQSVLKICRENKISVPENIKEHLSKTLKMQGKTRPVPGIRFNSVVSNLAASRIKK